MKTKKQNIPALVVCIVAFLALQVFQMRLSATGNIGWNGLVSQFQIIATLMLVLTNNKKGYIASIVLYVLSVVSVLMGAIRGGGAVKNAPSAIAVSICTIIVLSIVYNYILKSEKMHDELMASYEEAIESKRVIQEKDDVLSYLAYYDRLTQMPNRHLFMENLEEKVSNNETSTVLYIDLDNFRGINDSFGHATGDEMLKEYAKRIERIAGEGNFCAKIGGDEYGIILGSDYSPQDVISFVGRVQTAFNEPVMVGGNAFRVTASFGGAIFPRDANNVEDWFRCAETSMFMAKANGKNQLCFYSPVV